jgi:hypothetical protein
MTTALPRQLFLPGQVAAPDGPIDVFAMYLMHHAFRRDLDAFALSVPATPVTDRKTWRLLHRRWAVFAGPLHHHHSGEDAGLWPMLRERTDDAGRAVLDTMEADHAEIDPLLSACAAGFAALAEGADLDTRSALVVRVSATRAALLRHLAAEETEAMAMVQRLLSAQDWERLDKEHFTPAYGLRETLQTVPWVMAGLPAEARERLIGLAGPVLGVLWQLFLRRPYERRERRAFRYRSPQ